VQGRERGGSGGGRDSCFQGLDGTSHFIVLYFRAALGLNATLSGNVALVQLLATGTDATMK
jgi:hypothetical protein